MEILQIGGSDEKSHWKHFMLKLISKVWLSTFLYNLNITLGVFSLRFSQASSLHGCLLSRLLFTSKKLLAPYTSPYCIFIMTFFSIFVIPSFFILMCDRTTSLLIIFLGNGQFYKKKLFWHVYHRDRRSLYNCKCYVRLNF